MEEILELIAIAWLLLIIGTVRNASNHDKNWQRWGIAVGLTGFVGATFYGFYLLTE